MKFIIAGSRHFNDYALLKKYCDRLIKDKVTAVVCGCARGADSLGEKWAIENNIPVERFPADWNKHGKKAGYLRNTEMGKNSEGAIVFWDGTSKGSVHMINIAEALKLELHVIRYDEERTASQMW
jgi:hypothetical protein